MKLASVTLWTLVGAALAAGAYWSFLLTPESTAWSLAASAVLLLVCGFLIALTICGAIVGWQRGLSANTIRLSIPGIPGIVPAALLVAVVWWLVGSVTDRVTIYSGPINAWFIASFGWDDVSWLFTGIGWLATWIKWVVAPVVAISMMAGILATGWRTLAGAAWLTRALRPMTLLVTTVLVDLLIAVPWFYLVPWRPAGLPATSIELAFIIAKLATTALLMAVGVALIVRQTSAAD